MRFENWDVLLFPEGSKVPIQEFKTHCFVTRDNDSPYLQAQALLNPASFYPQNNIQGCAGQLPVLTSFVPSLPHNSPFRVSVHSWERPRPTRTMEGLMQPDDSVMYEVRIFADGSCVSASLFNQRAPWPHVIDLSSQLDRNGNQDNLRFPPFHEEILHHTHWDAGETYGRVRVVIAEGFSRPHRSPPFERVRDIIIFSYQHAPLHILECSNIAWPNPGMWQQPPRQFLKYSLGHDIGGSKDEDAHSHSPTRHEVRPTAIQNNNFGPGFPNLPYRLQPTPPTVWQQYNNPWPDREGQWVAPTPPISDPFVEPFKNLGRTRRNRSTLDDVSMPDYAASSSNSSRAISSMTGLSFGRNKEPSKSAPIDDEQYNQLIEALSPKTTAGGTCAPTNTPASAPCAVSKSLETQGVPSCSTINRPSALKELSQPGTRAPSGSSVRSRNSLNEAPQLPTALLSPSPKVISKKEGLSIHEDKENSNESGSVSPARSPSRRNSGNMREVRRSTGSIGASSESKRKRSASSAHGEFKDTNHGAIDSPSPSKKVSRLRSGQEEHFQGPLDDLLQPDASIILQMDEIDEAE